MTDTLRTFARAGDLTCILSDHGAATPLTCTWAWHSGPTSCAGPARTVHAPGGSIDPIVAAIDRTVEGEVLVVDGRAFVGAVVGGRLAYRAAARGAAGIVVVGRVRDVDALHTAPITVVALGVAPHRSDVRARDAEDAKDAPGSARLHVCDAAVADGDHVVVDGNGVVVVRSADVTRVVASLPRWIDLERAADAAAGVPGAYAPEAAN